MLKVLASQAAISLENSRLYRELQNAKRRSGGWSTPTSSGSSSGISKVRIREANDAFLRMVGYDREDLVSGRMRWTDLTPPNGSTAIGQWCAPAQDDRELAAV